MSVSRLLVENNGSNQESIKLALGEAFSICRIEDLTRITLVYPSKGSFKNSDIANFLGNQATTILSKGKLVDLSNGVWLELETPKNISPYGKYEVVVAAYLTGKDMDVVDEIRSANTIIYLPWIEDEGKRWLSTWSPETIGPTSWKVSRASLPAPIEQAILQLGRSINMSTGLSHGSDKDMAKRLFSEIRKQGYTATAEAVRQFAVNNGWPSQRAQELAAFSEKYIA